MFGIDYELRCGQTSDINAHLPRLHAEASEAAVIVELGVRGGNSTSALLAAVENHSGHVWSVDIAHPRVPSHWFDSPLWTFILGDDLTVLNQTPDNIDLLFIDTSHHYTHTLNELHGYGPRVRPGGVILLHDTELEIPDEAPPDDPPFPVKTAMIDWCNAYGLQPEFVTGCNGLGVIRR